MNAISPSVRVERIGNATLYCGDCREILPTLTGIGAVVTDPPYGIGWQPRVNHQDQPWLDTEAFDPRPWLSIGSHHLFWGAQYFAQSLAERDGWLAWIKRPLDYDFSEDGRSYATMELAWRDWGKAGHICLVWDGGKRQGHPDNRTFCHPAQKPIEVMRWCVGLVPADIGPVLDPFMGSGTTGVACAHLGRSFVGIEIEPRYFDVACRRIEEAQRQGDMLNQLPPAEDPSDARMADLFSEPEE